MTIVKSTILLNNRILLLAYIRRKHPETIYMIHSESISTFLVSYKLYYINFINIDIANFVISIRFFIVSDVLFSFIWFHYTSLDWFSRTRRYI